MSATDRPAQYVSFLLAGEEYAVDILRAREIVAYETLTRVPMAPACIRGVLNLRGRVVPVIDGASVLGLSPTEPTRWTCILMVEVDLDGDATLMGLMVDSVREVLDLSPADVEPPPPFGASARLDYLAGVAKVGNKIVMLLDIDRILSPRELLSATTLVPGADEEPMDAEPRAPPSPEAPALLEPSGKAVPDAAEARGT
jgi:purine-binding chemotaxis protein CheW